MSKVNPKQYLDKHKVMIWACTQQEWEDFIDSMEDDTPEYANFYWVSKEGTEKVTRVSGGKAHGNKHLGKRPTLLLISDRDGLNDYYIRRIQFALHPKKGETIYV